MLLFVCLLFYNGCLKMRRSLSIGSVLIYELRRRLDLRLLTVFSSLMLKFEVGDGFASVKSCQQRLPIW
jgi:hypothetical protein